MNAQSAKRLMREARDAFRAAIDDNRPDDAATASTIWDTAARAYVRAMRSHQTSNGKRSHEANSRAQG